MRRQIRWTERLDDGTKVKIRVSFHGHTIKWQFKRSDEREWDYDSPPTKAQWDELEQRIMNRYQRGHVAITKELKLVRKMRQECT